MTALSGIWDNTKQNKTVFERYYCMAAELLNRSFIPVFLIIGFSMKLWGSRGSSDKSIRYYWLTVISTVILVGADSLEFWAQRDPSLRILRIAFSVAGYVMLPVAALSIVLIVCPKLHRSWVLWIPAAVNLAVYGTAFVTPVSFGYGDAYNFVRGPLGYTVVWVSAFYIVLAVLMTWRQFRNRDRIGERFILYICAAACAVAARLDMKTGSMHLNTVIMISAIFLYIFRRSIDSNRDVVTKLLNRMCFYEDCRRFNPAISAIGSAGMNGLKVINEMAGHEAGDAALREIGKCLDEISSKTVYAYRTGGDEFALLFLHQPENKVHETMEKFKGIVRNRGYSISTGYAMRGGTYIPIQDLIRYADEDMHANKAKYYSEVRHDRRKSRAVQAEERREETQHENRADF